MTPARCTGGALTRAASHTWRPQAEFRPSVSRCASPSTFGLCIETEKRTNDVHARHAPITAYALGYLMLAFLELVTSCQWACSRNT